MIYDAFQKQAIDYINQGLSVLVSAPTGAGKTVIAEHVIDQCLKEGKKAIYTAPIKALSNQKYREFNAYAKDKVGILTGDITLNAGSALQIMTTEIFRNKILENAEALKEYSWIIFDEIHYIDDLERGSVWEESLIFLPEHMNILGLSATVPNIHQLSGWIESIHNRPIKVVIEEKRPVPLHFHYQCLGRIYDDFKSLVKNGYGSLPPGFRAGGRLPRHMRLPPNPLKPLVEHLQQKDLLPCIYFVFSRRRAQELAEEMDCFNFLSDEESDDMLELYNELCEKYDLTGESSVEKLKPFIARGVAYHHAGMLPTLKEVVEQLFTKRLLKIIFTTETFALGINMPARSVIFDELRKIYGDGFAPLKTRDFFQMAGRAGRRSIDIEGHVFTRVSPQWISSDELYKVIHSKPEKVRSQFNASYATLLHLYNHHGEDLYDIYPKSFHYFQVRKFLQKKAVQLLRAKVSVLKDLGHIQDERLTEKGLFASKVYGHELMLAEFFEHNVLEQLSVSELGILSLSMAYEPRKGTHKPPLSKEAQELESIARRLKKDIHKIERHYYIPQLSKRCYFHLTPALEGWMKGQSFEQIMERVDSDEGGVVRYFRMTVQVLREMLDAPISHILKDKIHQAIDLIDRDVIDSEKQLRS